MKTTTNPDEIQSKLYAWCRSYFGKETRVKLHTSREGYEITLDRLYECNHAKFDALFRLYGGDCPPPRGVWSVIEPVSLPPDISAAVIKVAFS